MKFRFSKKYFLFFLTVLIVETFIALFIKSQTIRGTVGDLLVVVLIYYFIQAFFAADKAKTIIVVGVLAVLVEFTQAFHLAEKLGVGDNPFFTAILGTTFDVNDLWAYVAGCAMVYILEFSNENPRPRKRKLF